MMRAVVVYLTLLIFTPILGLLVVLAGIMGVEDRPGGVYDRATRVWVNLLVGAAGVRIVLHGAERLTQGPRVYASNHVSWYDVFVLAKVIPRYKFVAKAELFRIPIFGPAARAVGTIPIQRENRKAAFSAYAEAARRIRAGASVIVFPEGTRGDDYVMRPFKKGPFVLAIAAQVPVVPVVVHGTIAVQRRGSWLIHRGTVNVHFLEALPTAGLSYGDRDRLSNDVWRRMTEALHAIHGVEVRSTSNPTAAVG